MILVWEHLFLRCLSMPAPLLRTSRFSHLLKTRPMVAPEFLLYRRKADVLFNAIIVTESSLCEIE